MGQGQEVHARKLIKTSMTEVHILYVGYCLQFPLTDFSCYNAGVEPVRNTQGVHLALKIIKLMCLKLVHKIFKVSWPQVC